MPEFPKEAVDMSNTVTDGVGTLAAKLPKSNELGKLWNKMIESSFNFIIDAPALAIAYTYKVCAIHD